MQCAFRLLLLIPLLYVSACTPVELDQPAETPSRIVLLGELIAGDSTHLRAGRSKPLSATTHFIPELESDIQITCSSSTGELALAPYEDYLLYSVYTTLFSNPAVIRAQTDYRIRATRPGFAPVEATVAVPAAFTGIATDAGRLPYLGDTMRHIRLQFAAMQQGARYVVEVLRAPIYISATFYFDGRFYDYELERAVYDSLVQHGEPVDVQRDTTYSDQLERQVFYSSRRSAENTASGAERSGYWFFLRPEAASLDFSIYIPKPATHTYGRHIVRMKAVSTDYYDFLRDYELGHLQPTRDLELMLKPTAATGNVKGGIGIVGGVYLHEAQFGY